MKIDKERSSSKKLTLKQRKYVEFLADPDNMETEAQFAKRLKIKPEVLNKWKLKSGVVEHVINIRKSTFGTEKPKVLKMLLQKALDDQDVSAAKLFLQLIENIKEVEGPCLSTDDALKLIRKTINEMNINNNK